MEGPSRIGKILSLGVVLYGLARLSLRSLYQPNECADPSLSEVILKGRINHNDTHGMVAQKQALIAEIEADPAAFPQSQERLADLRKQYETYLNILNGQHRAGHK